ncbi:hypothetical protein GCM10007968_12340 [Sporolactobacillus putidus]|uniref:Uncharacterized protein n=1 Tax=Sporolactobacillus putidus TaxID=492735 RepID=A0A917W1F4_9BACL|nr:hypothetical protein GCM10007968_12340 [Sporolactobacillus putidus]
MRVHDLCVQWDNGQERRRRKTESGGHLNKKQNMMIPVLISVSKIRPE